jgi:hypothetical protein
MTTAQIQRTNPRIEEAEAEGLAHELHAIMASYRHLF